ncbi:MAG: GNAT family N-acetyltransferase [Kiloniellaceae bacterium]
MTGVSCRLAAAADHVALARLFHENARHYFGDRAPTLAAMTAHVRDEVLGDHANVEILLAEVDGEAVGFASFAVVHPAPDLTGQLFLKDLFVTAAVRSGGIGEALLRALAQTAVARRCSRLDWTAEDYNPRALALYDRIGARRLPEKIYYRIDGDALKDFAAGGD